ncbi:hypothetical protein [Sinorhizobium americanum]|uniref:hypothetical protein n=1 Tax=Sinorhizobium americanum TaxID=194963 RepID=UPI00056AC069|nr:hypothetical protein [Sinorhizobium americanum]
MAIFFRTPLTDALAFEMIDERLSSRMDFDGYLNVYGVEDELTVTWPRGMSAGAFKEQATDALRSTWRRARFWLVYQRCDSRDDLDINEIRNAAIRLSQRYLEAAVVTLSLLGRTDSASDLELVFVCFRDESDRRNFRVRYEGKFVPES